MAVVAAEQRPFFDDSSTEQRLLVRTKKISLIFEQVTYCKMLSFWHLQFLLQLLSFIPYLLRRKAKAYKVPHLQNNSSVLI